MLDRFAQFPKALADKARSARFADIPVLLAHPDWERPAPTVLWLHGRTVNKELDPGRYLRWIRAGIAACAIDLPGHGERADADLQQPSRSLDLIARAVPEIDRVVEHLADPSHKGVFDLDRLGIGGMSAGGMVTLRRLCDPHPFRCASVECATGWLAGLYLGESGARTRAPWAVEHDRAKVESLDPMHHLGAWRPIPLLALHNEGDEVVPIVGQRRFLDALRERYLASAADPSLIELLAFTGTGAPREHSGFGRFSNDAKNAQIEFFKKAIGSGQ